ncbi:MAG: DUF485 domain-containing protein, partial [Novosphingobium sp.]
AVDLGDLLWLHPAGGVQPGVLGEPDRAGTTTVGIPLGIGVIIAGVMLTGIYVLHANRRFDELTRQIRDDAGL